MGLMEPEPRESSRRIGRRWLSCAVILQQSRAAANGVSGGHVGGYFRGVLGGPTKPTRDPGHRCSPGACDKAFVSGAGHLQFEKESSERPNGCQR